MSVDLATSLNPEQAAAASAITGPVLIIAGAGSGKTRMITYRIAHMLDQGIKEENILALTFTNKAAKEMAERIKDLTGLKLKHLTATTFHSFGLGLLKQYIQYLGYKNNFTIYDTSDNQSLIKDVIINLGFELQNYSLKSVLQLFSDIKTGRHTEPIKKNSALYQIYTEWVLSQKAYNVVDFDDLITLPIKIFESHPEILEKIQARYQYIMVDEFQDTSLLQYRFVSMIAQKNRNLCVVGDDDQSIYSWRGANYQNLVLFEQEYPERKEYKLERNYRSSGTILDAANNVIIHNTKRKEKKLWTDSGKGSRIYLINPDNGDEEAETIAERIHDKIKNEGLAYSDIGVLVRTNSLMNTLETTFMEHSIPVSVSGGQSFFDRREIRDILCYLKVLSNDDDDVSLLRIINTPRRGIGRVSVEKMRAYADTHKTSLFDAMSQFAYAADSPIKGKSHANIKKFTEAVLQWQEMLKNNKKAALIYTIIDDINYKGMLYEDYPDNDGIIRFKMKGLDFLADRVSRFEKRNPDASLREYLYSITLDSKDDQNEENGKVNLMTMHASKGLEFDTVYLPGLEDNIIPSSRAMEESQDSIYEERRLFYVAITRAKRELTMSWSKKRKDRMGELQNTVPSRFLDEVPKILIDEESKKETSTDDKLKMLDNFLSQLGKSF